MIYDTRLATRISAPVNRRLRMFALLQCQSLSQALTALLDQALPPADVLADELREKAS